jgi:hypothetical protein
MWGHEDVVFVDGLKANVVEVQVKSQEGSASTDLHTALYIYRAKYCKLLAVLIHAQRTKLIFK